MKGTTYVHIKGTVFSHQISPKANLNLEIDKSSCKRWRDKNIYTVLKLRLRNEVIF